MARLIFLGVLAGILNFYSTDSLALVLSYEDCLLQGDCSETGELNTLNISTLEKVAKLDLGLYPKKSDPTSSEIDPDRMEFDPELAAFLSNFQDKLEQRSNQSGYGNYQSRRNYTGFKQINFTSEERAHIRSAVENSLTTSKASRDLLTFVKSDTKRAPQSLPSDPYIFHKILAFHVVLIVFALVFFKLSSRA